MCSSCSLADKLLEQVSGQETRELEQGGRGQQCARRQLPAQPSLWLKSTRDEQCLLCLLYETNLRSYSCIPERSSRQGRQGEQRQGKWGSAFASQLPPFHSSLTNTLSQGLRAFFSTVWILWIWAQMCPKKKTQNLKNTPHLKAFPELADFSIYNPECYKLQTLLLPATGLWCPLTLHVRCPGSWCWTGFPLQLMPERGAPQQSLVLAAEP